MKGYTRKCLFVIISVLLTGCATNKNISLEDNEIKKVDRNVVTMNLKTGQLTK